MKKPKPRTGFVKVADLPPGAGPWTHCSHGKPFLPVETVCLECDLLWELDMLARSERGVREGKAKIKELKAAIAQDKAMGPDHSREGMFVTHNCHRCDHGKAKCLQGGPHRCEFPRARND